LRSVLNGERAHRRDHLNVSIAAGTTLHRSKLPHQLPLTTWFWAAHLMATQSNGVSARQLEHRLGVTCKAVRLLTQKLRRSKLDPDRKLLEEFVVADDSQIGIAD
jgi:hypothetical protein